MVSKLSQILATFNNGIYVYFGLCDLGLKYGLSIFRISCDFFLVLKGFLEIMEDLEKLGRSLVGVMYFK